MFVIFADMDVNQHKLNMNITIQCTMSYMTSSGISVQREVEKKRRSNINFVLLRPVHGILKQQNELIDNGLET